MTNEEFGEYEFCAGDSLVHRKYFKYDESYHISIAVILNATSSITPALFVYEGGNKKKLLSPKQISAVWDDDAEYMMPTMDVLEKLTSDLETDC